MNPELWAVLRCRLECFIASEAVLNTQVASRKKRWSGRSTTAHTVFDIRWLIQDFVESCTIDCSWHHYTAIIQCVLKCAILTFSSISNCWIETWTGGISIPSLGAREDKGARRYAHSIGRQWVPIRSPLTHVVHRSPFLGYIDGFKCVSEHSFLPAVHLRCDDITAVEVIV